MCPACGAPGAADRCAECGAALRAGGFHIERVISQSAHGRVYAAGGVALKELVFALAPDARTIDAFEREARVLASLDHEGIPRFVKAFREGSGVGLRLYLAQELIDGAPISPGDDPRDVARQVLEVLAYLHDRRVLHRDLKPANILRRRDGRIALVDFGVARELQREATHGATLVGTFGYMPIEQLGGTVDARSDLYALGATLLHLVTRTPPAERLRKDFSLDCSGTGELQPFLEKLTALQPAQRFSSARAALAALEAPPPKLSLWQRLKLRLAPRRPRLTRFSRSGRVIGSIEL